MKKAISVILCVIMLTAALPFVAAAGDENPFIDVPAGKWYTASVLWCYRNGYMAGDSANTFSPNKGMTRAMMVTVFAAVAGVDLKTAEYAHSDFSDVPDGKWYTRPVVWAAKEKITAGTGGNCFSPNAVITREQFVLMLRRLLEYSGVGTEYKGGKAFDSFGDKSNASGWAVNALRWASENGLISGTGTSNGVPFLSPKGTVTRAQAATFIRSALEKNLGGDHPVGSLSLGGHDISEFVIVYGADDTFKLHDDNKEAAEFLASALSSICGAELEVYRDVDRAAVEGACEILIGKTDREEKGLISVDRDFSLPTYIYEMRGNYLVFTCPDGQYGTSCAVARFLEDVCGATYIGKGLFSYASMKSASIADGVRTAKQSRYENGVIFDNWGDDHFFGTPDGDRLMLNLSHALPLLGCPGCEYGDSPISSGHHEHHYLSRDPCLSEPGAIDTIIRNVGIILENRLGDNKNAVAIVHVDQSDSGKYCQCEHCRDIFRLWGFGATYTQILTFVSEAFSEEYPNVRFMQYGCDQTAVRPKLESEISNEKYQAFLEKYGDLKYVPKKDITPPDNCILLLKSDTVCESHGMNDPDCPRNVKYLKNVAGWCEVYKTIYNNSFTGNNTSDYNVFPDFYEIRDTFGFFAGIENYKGYREFYFDNYEFDGLRPFLMARLTWDPFMSAKTYSDLIDRFLKARCGSGWALMREYIDKMEELSSANHWWTYNGVGDRWDSVLTRDQWKENIDYLASLFDRAIELCDTDEQLAAVRQSYMPLKYIACNMAYAQYKESRSDADLTAFSELSTAFYNELRELGMKYPDNWSATLDPDLWED